MRLVEQHTIKPSSVYYNELYDLLHKCKNLYNKGLYVVRQYYFQYKDDNTVKYKYLNYYSLEKKLRTENDVDYRALPAPVAQQVLMMVDRNFKSFFNLFNNQYYNKRLSYLKSKLKDNKHTSKQLGMNIKSRTFSKLIQYTIYLILANCIGFDFIH